MILRWAAVLVLLVLVAGSAWVLQAVDTAPGGASAHLPHTPDFYMERFTTTTMNSRGEPTRRLEAQAMHHFPDTNTNELEQPYLVLYNEGGQPWHVRSERGWVSENGDVILLLGEVDIWRDDAGGRRSIEIETKDLRVLPQSDYGETDQPVVIRTPSSETRGRGMRGYLEQSRVELLADVTTFYDPAAD